LFSGTLPPELGELTGLTLGLALQGNQLISGTLPSQLGRLTALSGIWLQQNALSGTVPAELAAASALTYLSLAENELSGTLPEAICDLAPHLRRGCDLGHNPLACPLPSCGTGCHATCK
jgi:hypothetical protein